MLHLPNLKTHVMKSETKTSGKLKIELDAATLELLAARNQGKRTGAHAGWLSRAGHSFAGWLVKKSK